MRLFIAEKPELGRAIAEAIGDGQKDGGCIRCGNGDVVTWCFGHLLTLTDPEDHDPSAKQWSMEKRGFIVEQSKKVISTDLGREFHDLLPESATAPDMTALWHEQQEQIRAGEMTREEFVSGVVAYVSQEIERIKSEGVKVTAATGPECPTCKSGTLNRRKEKSGFFWGCSAYPECKATFPDKRGKPDFNAKKAAAPSTEHLCPECNKGLIRRTGKKKGSYWWGCSGFPACNFRAFDKKGKPEVKN